ncbi:FecR family protein [Sphingomonas sp. OTU376]|uniref:FecR family protein n=1 Tax=Sphingomonas sp. OTU376 TaxID=3043863 RepID=UPI00313CDFFD
MNELPPEQAGSNQLLDEATLWFARMRGPEAAGHRPDFEAWLARGALHRAAYNHAAEIFSFGKFLAEETLPDHDRSSPGSTSARRGLLVGAIALACAVPVGLLSLRSNTGQHESDTSRIAAPRAPTAQMLRTLPGQGRVEQLADGSTVTLGPDSLLSVQLGEAERLLTLRRGRARFEVAKGQRPFVVAALETRVTAHGTVFDVAIGAGAKVKVRLIEGRIEVAFPAKPGRAPVRRSLSAGQSIEVQGESTAAIVSDLPPAAEASRAQGLKDYDAAPLTEVVREANRIAAITIKLAEPELGALRVSGRFRIGDTASLANRIAAVFDLRVEQASHEIILTRK